MTEARLDGCPICRSDWTTHGSIDTTIGVSPRLQTYLYRCVECGTFWESVISNWPRTVHPDEAAAFMSEPDFEPY